MFDEELFEFWPREHWTNFHEGKSAERSTEKLGRPLMKFVSNFYQVKIN